jgi:CBS domain-containing protein
MNAPISSMMVKQTKTIEMDDTIRHVEEVLRANNLSALPVVESAKGPVIGIISARDLARFHFEKRDPANVRAWEVCSYKPVEVGPDITISKVARLMVTKGVHHVLITDNGEIVGIVSALDFVKKFIQDER